MYLLDDSAKVSNGAGRIVAVVNASKEKEAGSTAPYNWIIRA